jgi:ketosteroid isomerase-like protein
MSESNLNVVKEAYRSYQQGDIDAVLSAMVPDIDWAIVGDPAHFPPFGLRRGEAGVRDVLQSITNSVDFHEFTPQEFYDAGDVIFVLGRIDVTMKKTGRRAASDRVQVFKFRDGKIAVYREFVDTATFVDAWRG